MGRAGRVGAGTTACPPRDFDGERAFLTFFSANYDELNYTSGPSPPAPSLLAAVDITLVNASIFQLPTSHRAAAIVYDGPIDLTLWRPPGPDRDLWEAYGEDLQDVLDKELDRLPNDELEMFEVLRLHPGKLHCDFLIWVASHEPHGDEQPAVAPDVQTIEQVATAALAYAARREVTRLAFPALGAGRDALDASQRIAAVVRAVQGHKEACFAAGRPAGIEEVVVCDASSTAITRARRLLARVAPTRMVDAKPAAAEKKPERKPAKSRATSTAKRSKGPSAAAVAEARSTASAYDRSEHYVEGQWFIHPTFGVGLVQQVQADRRIVVVFEDGRERTMIHARD